MNVDLSAVRRTFTPPDEARPLQSVDGSDGCRFAHTHATAELNLRQSVFGPQDPQEPPLPARYAERQRALLERARIVAKCEPEEITDAVLWFFESFFRRSSLGTCHVSQPLLRTFAHRYEQHEQKAKGGDQLLCCSRNATT